MSAATPDAQDFASLKAEVAVAADHLADSIKKARAAGLDTRPEEVTLLTANTFQNFADYDFTHRDELTGNFVQSANFAHEAPAEAAALPQRELSDSLKMIAAAEARLKEAPAQKAPVAWIDRDLDFQQGRIQAGGQTVFPSTINWLPSSNAAYRSAFGAFPEMAFSLANLRPDGSLDPNIPKRMTECLADFPSDRRGVAVFFLMHTPAKWMLAAHPEIASGAHHSTRYDIDNPDVRAWMRQLIAAVATEGKSKAPNSTRLYLLANEPHFGTARGWDAVPVSRFTVEKFHRWLAGHYSNIAALNKRWQSDFSGFDAVRLDVPLDPTLIGTPAWYDWCRFNMDRVTEWFAFLKSTILESDPEAKVTIKNIGSIFEWPARDHGIDIEALVKLQDVVGADLRILPANAIVRKNGQGAAQAWRERYSLEWMGQSMMLDFSKSLRPDALFYDSEWHGFSAEDWYCPGLQPSYVRTALWMGFLNGMGMIESWYWGRKADGSPNPREALIGSLLTQPLALDAYGRTLQELNSRGNEISAIAGAPRKILLLYVEESAIQEPDYTATVKSWYEAACQSGVPVGFVTPSTLPTLSTQNASDALVLIPPARYASEETLASVREAARRGVHLAAVRSPSLFLCDPWGMARTEPPLDKTPVAALSDGDLLTLAGSIATIYQAVAGGPAFRLQEGEEGTAFIPGIWSRSASTGPSDYLLALVNVSKQTKNFQIRHARQYPPEVVSLLTGQKVDPGNVSLPPLALDLLRIRTRP